MRNSIKLAVVAGIMTLGGLGAAAPAFAATTPVAGGNGNIASLTGNGAATYTDPVFGPVQCNETSHAKFDTVECQFTNGQVLTPAGVQTVGWNSDYPASGHSTGTLTYQIKADGSGYTGKAAYPNG